MVVTSQGQVSSFRQPRSALTGDLPLSVLTTSCAVLLCFCQAEAANGEQFLLSVGLLHAMGHADCGASTGDVSRSWSGSLEVTNLLSRLAQTVFAFKVDIFLNEIQLMST